MPLGGTRDEYECIICDDETFSSVEEAREHAMEEHKDDIVEEEWGHYFNQT